MIINDNLVSRRLKLLALHKACPIECILWLAWLGFNWNTEWLIELVWLATKSPLDNFCSDQIHSGF